jgi:hypothetical protein
MNSPIDAYHDFVDALVARRECVLAKRVQTAWRWPAESSFAKFNSLVEGLSQAQRDLLAALLQEARDGGIHDVLAEVSERANLKGFGLVQDGELLPMEPHGTEIYFDWVARCAGEAWPHEG